MTTRFWVVSGLAWMMCLARVPTALSAESPEAIAAIQKIFRKVVRDETQVDKPIVELSAPQEFKPDPALVYLKQLPRLRMLDLSCTQITDEGLKYVKSCDGLEVLELNFTHITEKGLIQLKDLPKLQTLSLVFTSISGEGLENLKEFKQLRQLRLNRDTDYSQAIPKLLKTLPELKIDQGNGNTADLRARKHFSIPDSEPVDTKTIRTAILAKLPLGSSSKSVNSFLTSCGIGTDKLSNFSRLKDGDIFCRIEFDLNNGWIVSHHYGIRFEMDDKGGLKGVNVQRWLTGP